MPTGQDGDKKPPPASGDSANTDVCNVCNLCGQALPASKKAEYVEYNRRITDKK
jgi:hypothetical protein